MTTNAPLYSGFPSTIFMFWTLVFAMSNGIEATEVTKHEIMDAVK